MKPIVRFVCLLFAAFLFAAEATPATGQQPIIAGLDLLETDPALTQFDFGAGNPIPADFFDPGSDPFTGIIQLDGGQVPPGPCPDDDLNGIDTIVQRMNDAVFAGIPSTAPPVQIEIIELSLVSSQPITVTYNGGQNPELWDVEVRLSDVAPQPPGQMIITRTHANGGTFDTDLPVLPKFVFTRGPDVRELDFGALVMPPVQLQGLGDAWEDKLPTALSCTSNWCPTPGGPLVLNAPNAQHGALPRCFAPTIPTLSTTMAIALLVLLLVAGTWIVRRRTAGIQA